MDCCPDAVVASWNESSVRSGFDDPFSDALLEQADGPRSEEGVPSSLLSCMESWFKADGYRNSPILKVFHDVAIS